MPVDKTVLIEVLKRIHLFRGMDDDTLEATVGLLEPFDLPSGQSIYKQEELPDYFYFILEGEVRTSRLDPQTGLDFQTGRLGVGDYFGEEVLENEWVRQSNAETLNDVKLARLSVPNFIILLDKFPPLAVRLQLILDSFRLRQKTRFNWLDSDETVYFVTRRHKFFLLLMILPPILVGMTAVLVCILWYLSTLMLSGLLFLGLSVLVSLAWLAWNYVDWSNDYYVVTDQRVVYQERVILLYDSRLESPLEAVQSTNIFTTLWGRWLGYGNLAIRTYIGTILFRRIAYPDLVQTLIQERQLHAQYQETRTETKQIREKIDKRIRFGPETPALPSAGKPKEKPDQMRAFLSTMFHLRYETGGTVTFRTHWFILLKKIFLPSLILSGLLFAFIYNMLNRFELLSIQATCGIVFLLGLIVFGWWLYQYLDWHNDVYLITPDQIIDVSKKPLGREDRNAMPILNILSIEYERLGIIGLLLNFGTVYIRVGDQKLTFDNVLNPASIQRELFHSLAKKKFEDRNKKADEDRKRMADWIATYDEWKKDNPPLHSSQPPTRSGF